MIPNSQIFEIIEEQFPAMKIGCSKSRLMDGFREVSKYARGLLINGNADMFSDLVCFIDQLYYHGDGKLKVAVDNILLHDLSTYIDMAADANQIRQLLPSRMRDFIVAQYGASCI
jgi:hypothetical protein